MKKYKFCLSLRLQGCEITEEVEIDDDDATEDEVEEILREWVFEQLEFWKEEEA